MSLAMLALGRFFLWSLALGATLCQPALAAPERVQYALIVANNSPETPDLATLKFADDDAARYYELLAPQVREAVLLAVLDEETQKRHPGLAALSRPPTRQELLSALDRLNGRMSEDRRAGREPVFFFIFSGHGKRDQAGEGLLLLLGGSFSRADLFEKVLAPSQADFIHLVIDACDSYYFVSSRGSLPVGQSYAELVTRYLDERSLARYPNVGVVLSTAGSQESHEWAAISSGVFSHQIRSALSGAADVNMDGRVEYSELRAFVASANARVEDPRGKLHMFALPPARDRAAAITDYRRPSGLAYLLLPAELGGRHWVEDERGVRVAEFHKEQGRHLVVALLPGRTYWLRSLAREARFVTGAAGAVVDGGGASWAENGIAARGSLDEAFREALFTTPFGPRFYAGYVSSTGEPPVAEPARPDLSP